MKSLRETLETVFAAAAFAERNLPEEARGIAYGDVKRTAVATKRRRAKDVRPRPTLKA